MAINSDDLVCCEVCDQPVTGIVLGPRPGQRFAIPCYDTLTENEWDQIAKEIEELNERTNEA